MHTRNMTSCGIILKNCLPASLYISFNHGRWQSSTISPSKAYLSCHRKTSTAYLIFIQEYKLLDMSYFWCLQTKYGWAIEALSSGLAIQIWYGRTRPPPPYEVGGEQVTEGGGLLHDSCQDKWGFNNEFKPSNIIYKLVNQQYLGIGSYL